MDKPNVARVRPGMGMAALVYARPIVPGRPATKKALYRGKGYSGRPCLRSMASNTENIQKEVFDHAVARGEVFDPEAQMPSPEPTPRKWAWPQASFLRTWP